MEGFSKSKSFFFSDGYLPICNDCVKEILKEKEFSWEVMDKICQYADIPFVPAKFEELREALGDNVFPAYAKIFLSEEFEGLGWGDYFRAFKELQEQGDIEEELPGLRQKKIEELAEKWGANYDLEALNYLENLYKGLLSTQNVNGALQTDQALKICKISYELDCRIRAGADFDKMLTAYDKLVKVAEFTPRNVKSANDFESVGELFRFLERRGWRNKFYDGVTRDIVDETIKNIQNFNQRLYTNETGIGEEITRRIEALKSAKEIEKEEESYYGIGSEEYDLDVFDDEGYKSLFGNDDFEVEVDN